METRGGFTFQKAVGGSSFMVSKNIHLRVSMSGAPPAGQANSSTRPDRRKNEIEQYHVIHYFARL